MPPARPAALFAGRPTVVGHRGCGAGVVDGHAENTVASLLLAVACGLDWVELDVRRAAGGELVLLHEPAPLDGVAVVDRPAAELRAHGVVTLTEALDALPPHVGVDVDVKPSLEDALVGPDETTAALLAPVLAAERARRSLLVTSFDATSLMTVRARVPGVPTGLLTWIRFPVHIAVAMAAQLGVDAVGVHVGSLTRSGDAEPPLRADAARVVDVAHRAGLRLLAWCPGPQLAATLADVGVDVVVVDRVPADWRQPQTRSTTCSPARPLSAAQNRSKKDA